jgi:hypothetical protein
VVANSASSALTVDDRASLATCFRRQRYARFPWFSSASRCLSSPQGGADLTLAVALRYITWAVYLIVFLLVLRRAVRTPTPAHRDIALFFGATATLIVLISAETILGTSLPRWFSIVVGAIAVTLPYLLLRLMAGFAQTPPWVPWLSGVGLAACILALVFTPAPSPPAVTLLLVCYFVHREL